MGQLTGKYDVAEGRHEELLASQEVCVGDFWHQPHDSIVFCWHVLQLAA